MDRPRGTSLKQSSLLSRWLSPTPEDEPPVRDAHAMLRDLESDLRASYSIAAVAGLTAPIRHALEAATKDGIPPLGPAFELIEEVLEAAALTRPSSDRAR